MIRGVWQRVPLAGSARGEQELAHRRAEAHADRGDIGADELHRVVDRHAGGDRTAGRVHVQPDVLLGVLALEVQQLRGDEVRDVVVHVGAEEDDALLQQPVEDVHPLERGALLLRGRREEVGLFHDSKATGQRLPNPHPVP